MMALSLVLLLASSVAAQPGDGKVQLNVFTEWMWCASTDLILK
jgi:hypothetical protein